MKKMLQTICVMLIVTLNSFCSHSRIDDDKKIIVSFAIDDSVQNITGNFNVDFISGADTLPAVTENNYLILPNLDKDTTYEVIFNYSVYALSFKNVTKKMIIPEQNLEWKFGIDNRPFNILLGLLPYEEFKTDTTTKLITYLQFNLLEFGDGIQLVNKLQY